MTASTMAIGAAVAQQAAPPAEQADRKTIEIGNPGLKALYAYWTARCGTREMPARADLDPMDMRKFLRHIVLVDVEHGDRTRLRYRLVGTALAKAIHQDPTGRYIDEMPFWFRKFAEPAYADVLTRRRPHYRTINTIENWWIVKYERLLMPLSSDGVTIDMVIGGMYQQPK